MKGGAPSLQFQNKSRVRAAGTTISADDSMQVQVCLTQRWRSHDTHSATGGQTLERAAGWKGIQARWRWEWLTGRCNSCWNHADLPCQNSTTIWVHVCLLTELLNFYKCPFFHQPAVNLHPFLGLASCYTLASLMQTCDSLQYVTINGSNEVYGRYRNRLALLAHFAVITSGSCWHP